MPRHLVVSVCVAVVVAVLAWRPAPAAAGDGAKALALAPPDAKLAVLIDVADARDSAMYAAMLDALGKDAAVGKALRDAGVDLATDVDTVVVAGDKDGAMVMVLEGRIDDAQVATLTKDAEAKRHRKVTYWVVGDGELARVGKRWVFTTPGEMKQVIDRDKKKAKGLARAPAGATLRAAIALADARHDIRVAVLADGLGLGNPGVDVAALGVTLGKDLTIEARARFADAAAAGAALAELEPMLGAARSQLASAGLGSFASSISLAVDDRVLDVDAQLTEAELSGLVGLLQMF